MPKHVRLLLLFFFLSQAVSAQMYWQVTHASGTQNVGNFPVTVTRAGLDTMWQLAGSMSCPTVGPYLISAMNGTQPECGYTFSFANPVDSIRLRFHTLHVNELVRIEINGAPYNLTPANISSLSTCLSAAPAPAAIVNGRLTCGGSNASDYADVEVNIQTSYTIDSVKVLDNSTTNATLFYFAFVNNSCSQDLNATANSPCVGNTLFLHSLGIPGAIYSWTGPGGYTSSQQGPTRANVPAGAGGDYIVTASFGNGCLRSDTVHVTVQPLPPTPVAATNSPVCLGDTLRLMASGSGTGALYVWSGPGNFNAVAADTFIYPATVTSAGTYLFFAVNNGCISAPGAAQVSINTNTLTPNASISASPGTVIATGTAVTFTAVTNLGINASYQWRKNGQPVSGATAAAWTTAALVNGDMIDVIVSSSQPCVQPHADTSNALMITVQNGVAAVNGKLDVTLYPNPSNGHFTLGGNLPADAVLTIYDQQGRVVWQRETDAYNSPSQLPVHMANAAPGVYYLRVTAASGAAVLLFTVQ